MLSMLKEFFPYYHHIYQSKCDAGYIPFTRQITLAQQQNVTLSVSRDDPAVQIWHIKNLLHMAQ